MERRRSSNNVLSPCRLGSTSSAIKTETLNTSWTGDFKVLDTIGRGKFAVVKKCVDKSTGQQYAAKCIRKRRHNRDCTPDILHEIAVLEMGIDHPHLIKLHKVYETASEFVLILEYAAGGEIFDHCVGVKDTFSENSSRRLMRQILDAVHFLHTNDIVHLDLKPQNILLSKDGSDPDSVIKLVDFGLSKYISAGLEIREILGTPDYVAPEVLNYEPLSTATDMWSLGVVAYVLLTGVSPFLGDTKQDTLMNVTTAAIDFPEDLFSHMSPSCQDFIRIMLQRDPIDRCTAHQAINHSWITGIVAPELPLQQLNENGHEDVFLNGDCDDGDASQINEETTNNAVNDEDVEPKPTSSQMGSTGENGSKMNECADQGSDVDINGNIVDENTQSQSDSLLSTPTSYQTLSDLSVLSDDSIGSSVDYESTTALQSRLDRSITKTPVKSDIVKTALLKQPKILTDSNDAPSDISIVNITKAEFSPSPRITRLSLSSSSQPTSPVMPSNLPKEFESAATDDTRVHSSVTVQDVKTDSSSQSTPNHSCRQEIDVCDELGSSVDPIARNTSNNNALVPSETVRNVHSTDPCFKRRKFDYGRVKDQSASEISVAD